MECSGRADVLTARSCPWCRKANACSPPHNAEKRRHLLLRFTVAGYNTPFGSEAVVLLSGNSQWKHRLLITGLHQPPTQADVDVYTRLLPLPDRAAVRG